MNLAIHKSPKNTGKFFHKAPRCINMKKTRYYVCKEITDYVAKHNDLGIMNYIYQEYNIVTKLNPNTTYTLEDLY